MGQSDNTTGRVFIYDPNGFNPQGEECGEKRREKSPSVPLTFTSQTMCASSRRLGNTNPILLSNTINLKPVCFMLSTRSFVSPSVFPAIIS